MLQIQGSDQRKTIWGGTNLDSQCDGGGQEIVGDPVDAQTSGHVETEK